MGGDAALWFTRQIIRSDKMTKTISPEEAQLHIAEGAVLIDIRDPDEFARVHIPGARNIPLIQLGRIDDAEEVIFHCRSGMRTASNTERLAASVDGSVYLLEGGIEGWRNAGLACREDKSKPIEIMRQVQIVAGTLVLAGVLLGFLIAPAWIGLAAFVGAGLLMAGITGWCGMAHMLALMPWNRRRES
jgi:rhodanese-related sulfurtransferase